LKRKTTQKKKNQEKKFKGSKHKFEITGIFLFALGLLLFFSLYINNSIGVFGVFIKSFLLGMFGFPALLIPLAVLIYSAFLIVKRTGHEGARSRLIHGFILFVLVSAIIQAILHTPDDYRNFAPVDCIKQFYQEGNDFAGGGVFGGLLSLPLLMVFQKAGTLIILTAITLVEIIIVTNRSIANFISNMRSAIVNNNRNRKTNKQKQDISFSEDDLIQQDFFDDKNTRKSNIINFEIAKTNKSNKDTESEEVLSSFDVVNLDKNLNFTDTAADEKAIKSKGIKQSEQDAEAIKVIDDLKNSLSTSSHSDPNSEKKYVSPPIELLKSYPESGSRKSVRNQIVEGAKKLEETLASFNVSAKVVNVSRGPTVTRYELQPSAGVKVSKIVNLADDIALNLAASGVRIEAPIPGKAAIGIEVPNKDVNVVALKDVIESAEFVNHNSKICFALGKDISGNCMVADIAKMPHLLIAGATGSGKSVCINNLIVSLLYKASPEEVKLLLIDPKVVELGVYNGIPHLLIPVVTEPKKAAAALNWAVQEMVNRYKLFAEKSVRDLSGYNEHVSKTGEDPRLPQIVIVIDELADLMMVAPNEVEDAICRLAQMARAAGMHLVIATQRPSVDVITGTIKANIPSRISFAVSSQVDSRTILDMGGAEKLLGRGDMLFHPVGKHKPTRIQGSNITDAEVERVVDFVKLQGSAIYDDTIIEEINNDEVVEQADNDNDYDELLPKTIELVVDMGQASVSLIQRKFRVGYARAARIIDQMEERGVIGGYEGSKPRQVLMTKQEWHEIQMASKQQQGD
jgi:S-DNA-T family DNA segregation ATPase FtsK/SpoIIIE